MRIECPLIEEDELHMGVAHQGRQPNPKRNSFLKTSPAAPREVRRGLSVWREKGSHS